MISEKSLLSQAVLGRVKYTAFGANRGNGRCCVDASGRNVLEFEGYDVNFRGEAFHGFRIVIGRDYFAVGDVSGG